MIRIYGVPFSAHTRKVLVALREKQLDFTLTPLVPLLPDLPADFVAASPLRKIPVLIHDDVTVADSTVIALYLDRVFPDRPIYPVPPELYAKALFTEELIDGSLAHSVLHGVLMQRVLGPHIIPGFVTDGDTITAAQANIAQRLGDLEARLEHGWFAGEFSYADVTMGSIMMNLHYAGERLDATTFPKLAAHFERFLGRPSITAGLTQELGATEQIPGMNVTWLRERLRR